MATKPVKWFSNTMAGAPTLNGVAGNLIAVLDACLVNGFNQITLDSLVVASGVLTGTKNGHGFIVDQVIATAGANEAPLVGEWVVTEVTANAFKADATGVANVTGTGTITAKAAPLGWTKAYSGTNKAAYKSSDPTATGMYLRVDDTGTVNAQVVGYEEMFDVDNGTAKFPTEIQRAGGLYWPKSSTADTTARGWTIVGNSKTFYTERRMTSGINGVFNGFGDYTSDKSGDAYSCLISGNASSTATTGNSGNGLLYSNGYYTEGLIYGARSYSQIGGSIQLVTYSLIVNGASASGISAQQVYPSPLSNKVQVTPVVLREVTSGHIRCVALPGFYHSLSALPLTHLERTYSVTGLNGKKLMACYASTNGAEGRVFFDLTGPWV